MAAKPMRSGASAHGSQTPESRARAIRCLILDDSSFDRRLVRTAARGCTTRFTFIETATIQETRERLATIRPDVCLIDYRLPDGDGIDFVRELHEDPEFASVPTIVISHTDGRKFEDAVRAAGASGYLAKRGLTAETLDGAIAAAFAGTAMPAPSPDVRADAAGDQETNRDDTLARLGKLKGDLLRLLAQSWQVIDQSAEPDTAVRTKLSSMTRTAISTIDDLTLDTVAGSAHPAPEALVLKEILRDAAAPLEDTLRARQARVTATALPVIRGVRAHFFMLFEQLLLHALRFGRLGKKPLIEFGGGRARDGSWTIWYKDSGVNLATRVQSDRRVFESEDGTGDEPLPAGFGLSICQRVVERNGGRLSIFGEPDGGCRILMRFDRPENSATPDRGSRGPKEPPPDRSA